MVVEIVLKVRAGEKSYECEVVVPAETEIHSYNAGEKASFDSPGEPEEVEWSLVSGCAVTVNGVEVLAEGAALDIPEKMRDDMREQLLRDAREDRAVSAAGY